MVGRRVREGGLVRSRREADLFALVDSLYEAAFDPGRWDEALQGAMRLLGAHAGKAGRVDLASGGGRTLGLQGIDPVRHERWQTEHGADDLWAQAARERLATSPIRTATGRELVPVEALRARPAFPTVGGSPPSGGASSPGGR